MVEINTSEYLAQLLKDKKQLDAFPSVFIHLERILDEEISRIRVNLFQLGGRDLVCLPEPLGAALMITEKLYVPVKDHPEFNFVGRILGPRGMTAKQLEQETGCKIMVRGKGSMRDKGKEEQMKGKPNWEHLNDELHVLITVEDTKNRAELKMKRAVEEIKRLLVPAPDGEDELKKKQLMELAIINGTYRDGNKLQQKMNQILQLQQPGGPGGNGSVNVGNGLFATGPPSGGNTQHGDHLRSPPNSLGQPLIISPRLAAAAAAAAAGANILNGAGGAAAHAHAHAQAQAQAQAQAHAHAQLIAASSADPSSGGYIYTTIPASALYPEHAAQLAAFNLAAAGPQALLDFPNTGIDFSQAGSIKPRFTSVGSASMRAHPYARVAL